MDGNGLQDLNGPSARRTDWRGLHSQPAGPQRLKAGPCLRLVVVADPPVTRGQTVRAKQCIG
jgi:hypothetical protein